MTPIVLGIIAGMGFGIFVVLMMMPMTFEDKRQALLSAFASRFAIGFIIPNLDLPLPLWVGGALIGFLASLSDAIVTRAYAPILVVGTLGGAVIGYLADVII